MRCAANAWLTARLVHIPTCGQGQHGAQQLTCQWAHTLRERDSPLHPLLASRFAWRFLTPLDLMHVGDCNGVANIIAGSVIKPLVLYERRLGNNQEERLQAINERMQRFYDERPGYSRMAPLRVGNLTSEGWCVLNGSTVKAANTRALSPFLVELAAHFYDNDDDEYSRLAQRATRCLDRLYVIIYTEGVFLSASALAEFRRVLLRFGMAIQQLRELARARNLLAWNMTPKVHMFQHMDQQAAVVNPRVIHNYSEESQIGTTTAVWRRSASGRYRRTVQRIVLCKRLVSLMIRLERDL